MLNMTNFIVIWSPLRDSGVDKAKVIDAWACTDPSLLNAHRQMVENTAEYKAKYGEGLVSVYRAFKFEHIL